MVEDINKDRRGGSPRIFSYARRGSTKKIKGRLLLTRYLDSAWLLNVKKCYIHPFCLVWPCVRWNFIYHSKQKRGRWIWKMNLSHIENENFQKEINDFWREWKNEKGKYEDVGLWWDIGKTYIKRIAIEFSIKKQKENCAEKKKAKEDLRLEREQTTTRPGKNYRLNCQVNGNWNRKTKENFLSVHIMRSLNQASGLQNTSSTKSNVNKQNTVCQP